jgi:ABC-type microcin C transport system duplicated ATPase subunit YejF
MALLEIEDLNVTFKTADGDVNAVNGVSFQIDAGPRLRLRQWVFSRKTDGRRAGRCLTGATC